MNFISVLLVLVLVQYQPLHVNRASRTEANKGAHQPRPFVSFLTVTNCTENIIICGSNDNTEPPLESHSASESPGSEICTQAPSMVYSTIIIGFIFQPGSAFNVLVVVMLIVVTCSGFGTIGFNMRKKFYGSTATFLYTSKSGKRKFQGQPSHTSPGIPLLQLFVFFMFLLAATACSDEVHTVFLGVILHQNNCISLHVWCKNPSLRSSFHVNHDEAGAVSPARRIDVVHGSDSENIQYLVTSFEQHDNCSTLLLTVACIDADNLTDMTVFCQEDQRGCLTISREEIWNMVQQTDWQPGPNYVVQENSVPSCVGDKNLNVYWDNQARTGNQPIIVGGRLVSNFTTSDSVGSYNLSISNDSTIFAVYFGSQFGQGDHQIALVLFTEEQGEDTTTSGPSIVSTNASVTSTMPNVTSGKQDLSVSAIVAVAVVTLLVACCVGVVVLIFIYNRKRCSEGGIFNPLAREARSGSTRYMIPAGGTVTNP